MAFQKIMFSVCACAFPKNVKQPEKCIGYFQFPIIVQHSQGYIDIVKMSPIITVRKSQYINRKSTRLCHSWTNEGQERKRTCMENSIRKFSLIDKI